MHGSTAELAELSDVNIEIVPQLWLRRKPIIKRIAVALRAAEAGYVKYSIFGKRSSVHSRVYKKLYNALHISGAHSMSRLIKVQPL